MNVSIGITLIGEEEVMHILMVVSEQSLTMLSLYGWINGYGKDNLSTNHLIRRRILIA